MNYRHRLLERVLAENARLLGAVVVTGPRQAGKTSLLSYFSRTLSSSTPFETITFDTPSEIDAFRRDPDLFFANHPNPLFLDEIQHVPDIFPYLKREIDRSDLHPRFLISGSQHFGLMRGASESLAGRAAVFDLWPFAAQEQRGTVSPHPTLIPDAMESPDGLLAFQGCEYPVNDTEDVAPLMFSGGYPPSLLTGGNQLWLESYRRTYLDRDVRDISRIHDIGKFDRLLTLLAGRTGTMLNKQELGNVLNIDNKSIDHWLDILIATYQAVSLPPYFVNATKRVAKRPKHHFADIGLALTLQGIRDKRGLMSAPHFGHLFESFVVMEIRKLYGHAGRMWNGHYWRDAGGKECDLVLSTGGRLVPIEIKHTAKPGPEDTRGIDAFRKQYGNLSPVGLLISMFPRVEKISRSIWNIPLGLILNGPQTR